MRCPDHGLAGLVPPASSPEVSLGSPTLSSIRMARSNGLKKGAERDSLAGPAATSEVAQRPDGRGTTVDQVTVEIDYAIIDHFSSHL